MKNLIIFLLFTGKFLFSQGVDPIKEFPGIPLLTYIQDQPKYIKEESFYKKMESAGFFGTEVANMEESYLKSLGSTQLKILPNQVDDMTHNAIIKYTDAYYSVWEAEAMGTADGDASIYYDNTLGKKSGNGIKTRIGAGTKGMQALIYGPYYRQEIKYAMVSKGDPILYRVDFRLKKENIKSPPPNPDETICILQVTTSHLDPASRGSNSWFDSTFVIASLSVKYRDLADIFKTISITYDYTKVPGLFTTPDSLFRAFADYVEFKVIYKTDYSNRISLHVDNIILSDKRGRILIEPKTAPQARREIINQIEDNYGGRTVGWIGADEPESIDQFEPIRIVQNIIDANGKGKSLWFAYGNHWNGRWGDVGNPFGSYGLSQFEVFYKRVKKANLWSDMYLYTHPDLDYKYHGTDWQDGKIRVFVDQIYSHFPDKQNVFWGAIIQGGLYDKKSYSWLTLREMVSKELLYHVNLTLMCGAKIISFWTYSANITEGRHVEKTALVNVYRSPSNRSITYDYTDKWYTIKDTLAPRLSGLMGKTLKKLNPLKHTLSMNTLSGSGSMISEGFVSYIKSSGRPDDVCVVDLGFFRDPDDVSGKYFMPVNRYYSTAHNFTFGLRELTGYRNWKVTDYVDSNSFSITSTNGIAEFTDDFYPGDAKLYGVKPVVNQGGWIVYPDTINNTQTLIGEPLYIKSGGKLVVSGTYNIHQNIIVEAGGELIICEDSELNFYKNSKLVVYGKIIRMKADETVVL